jgi:hypothetical protein
LKDLTSLLVGLEGVLVPAHSAQRRCQIDEAPGQVLRIGSFQAAYNLDTFQNGLDGIFQTADLLQPTAEVVQET